MTQVVARQLKLCRDDQGACLRVRVCACMCVCVYVCACLKGGVTESESGATCSPNSVLFRAARVISFHIKKFNYKCECRSKGEEWPPKYELTRHVRTCVCVCLCVCVSVSVSVSVSVFVCAKKARGGSMMKRERSPCSLVVCN